MLNTIYFRLFVSTLLVCVASASTYATTSKETKSEYREKFGRAESEVRHTKETSDDAAFAQRLLTEADGKQHGPELTTYLYEKAYELGLRDTLGYPTANTALDKLLEEDASRKFDVGEMRLSLWEKWHKGDPNVNTLDPEAFIDLCLRLSSESVEAGDIDRALKFLNRGNRFASRRDLARKNDVRDALTDLNRHRKVLDEIAELEEQIGKDPAAADNLAMLYLAQLDDPAKAATYADQMSDTALAAQIRLAATAFKLATPAQATEAGAFYFGLVDDKKSSDTVAMLIRSRVWLIEYLSREVGEADTAKAANDTLGEIDAALLKKGIGKKLRRKMSSLVRGEGQFDRPADVQAAIDKGVKWLYEQHNPKTHWEKNPANHRNYGGYTALVVYALLMADEEPQINGDLSRSVHFMMNTDMKGTYAICFRIHAWEVMPRRERYRQVLMQDVNRLRKGSTRHGFWGYNMTGNDVILGKRLDMSTTLAGGLGLWIGEEVGGMTPKKVYWERVARGVIDHQLPDDGWSYNPAIQKTSQGAMTAAGIALLHASYPHLSDATKAMADESIAKGMKWMDANFSATTNVNRTGFKNYYYAAVQHAGLFSGKRDFRAMDWYTSIAEHLVKSQSPTGAWGDTAETAFAIAFLCRGGIDYEPTDSDHDVTEPTDDASEASDNEASTEPPAE
ncbi:MAG: hypothetical protein AB8C95_06355 [Phycisphaeraceae bacterium]